MTDTTKVTPADLEAKFRDIQGQVDNVTQDGKKKAAVGGSLVAVLLLLVIYTLGRKAGKKKSTVIEIRRL